MPNRIIKESVCRSEEINSLSWFEEVLFYRLIVACDDYGRFDGREAVIKGYCFPLKDVTAKDIKKALDKLVAVGLARVYTAQGRPILQLSTWERHQQIRAKKSKYPEPDGTCIHSTQDAGTCNQLISDDCNSPRNRESGIEYERESPPAPMRRKEGTQVAHFGEFCEAYPKSADYPGAQYAYCRVLLEDSSITEQDLVAAAVNYAEAVRIQGRTERYIRNPESFLSDHFFAGYLPGQYRRPEAGTKKGQKNSFGQFQQNEYDFAALEDELVSN